MARVLLVVVTLAALVASGCLNVGSLTGASAGVAGTSLADQMLQHPPGFDTVPTGITREFDLYLFNITMEVYPGAKMGMWAFSLDDNPAHATVPGPTLRANEGDRVLVHFHPEIAGYNHTIHWHGMDVPWTMDGVPFVTQKPVEPGTTFDYDFIAKPAGTYWYHCHVDAAHHVDMGMYGAFIVDPAPSHPDPHYDKEFLVMLGAMDRFHLEGGQPATGNLPESGDPNEYAQWGERQASDVLNRNPAITGPETGTPLNPQRNWTQVTYQPYTPVYNTFTIDGMSFPYTPVLVVQNDTVVRLRVINTANIDMGLHLHGHHLLVTHRDGVLLQSPYWVDTLTLGPGERYDVYVKMDNPGMWELHDHIGGHDANDNIFPGGAMTMLCYVGIEGCNDTGMGGMPMRSGDLVNWRWNQLWMSLP
jgi:FtsP/CotA-like multicopper oxidase with cupredoxin domain